MNFRRVTATILLVGIAELVNKSAPLILVHLGHTRLGLETFGKVQYLIGLFETLAMLVTFGFHYYSMLMFTDTSSNTKDDRNSKITAIISFKIIHAFFASACLYLILRDADAVAKTIGLLIAVGFFANIFNMVFLHTVRQKIGQLAIISAAIRFSLAILAFYFVKSAEDAVVFAACIVGTNIIVDIYSFFDYLRQEKLAWPRLTQLKSIWITAAPYGLFMLLTVLSVRADLLLAEVILDSEDLGIYSGLNRLFGSLQNLIVVLGGIFLAESFISSNGEQIRKLVKINNLILMQGLAAGVILFAYYGGEIISLAIGEVFSPYQDVFFILLLSLFFFAVQNISMNLYLLRRKAIFTINAILLLQLAASTVFSYSFRHELGMYGLAVGILVVKIAFLGALPRVCPDQGFGKLVQKESLIVTATLLVALLPFFLWDSRIVGLALSLTLYLILIAVTYRTRLPGLASYWRRLLQGKS